MKYLKEELQNLNNNMSEMMVKMLYLEENENHTISADKGHLTKEVEKNATKTSRFKCDECNSSYSTYTALDKHMEQEHGLPEFFQCKICKACFDTMMSLNKHTHTKHSHVHLKDNKFECKVCDKKFWNSLDLIEHLNDHVTEENVKYTECHDDPFRCKICGTFTSIDDFEIRKHVIKHVEDTLQPKGNSEKEVLPTIQEDHEEDIELDDSKGTESDLNDSDLFEGFDEDGNRIT